MNKINIIKKSEQLIKNELNLYFNRGFRVIDTKNKVKKCIINIEKFLKIFFCITLNEDEKEIMEMSFISELKENFDIKTNKEKIGRAFNKMILILQEYYVLDKLRRNKIEYFISSIKENFVYYIRKIT